LQGALLQAGMGADPDVPARAVVEKRRGHPAVPGRGRGHRPLPAHIGTVPIVGGDSDFMPLAQKIKAAGRMPVGVGTQRSTNRHWAKSCHEFRYDESLVPEGESKPEGEFDPALGVSVPDEV
jgi:hypothetical protein